MQVSLWLGGLAAAERASGRHFRQLGRHRRIVGRERVEEQQSAPAFLDVVRQVIDLFLCQRRRLGDQKDVQIGPRSVCRSETELTSYCFSAR